MFHFWVELWHLVEAAFGEDKDALASLPKNVGYKEGPLERLNETIIMLVVLGLIDVASGQRMRRLRAAHRFGRNKLAALASSHSSTP